MQFLLNFFVFYMLFFVTLYHYAHKNDCTKSGNDLNTSIYVFIIFSVLDSIVHFISNLLVFAD